MLLLEMLKMLHVIQGGCLKNSNIHPTLIHTMCTKNTKHLPKKHCCHLMQQTMLMVVGIPTLFV